MMVTPRWDTAAALSPLHLLVVVTHILVLSTSTTTTTAFHPSTTTGTTPTPVKGGRQSYHCWRCNDDAPRPSSSGGLALAPHHCEKGAKTNSCTRTMTTTTTTTRSFAANKKKQRTTEKKRRRPKSAERWVRCTNDQINSQGVGSLHDDILKQIPPLMNVYAQHKSREGATKTTSLLKRLIHEVEAGNDRAMITLRTSTCNKMLHAWAMSGVPNVGDKVSKLLPWMNRLYHEHHYNTKPDAASFTIAIKAYANSNAQNFAEKAEDLLNLMEQMDVEPTTITYNAIMNAWSRSDAMDKAVRAEAILDRMDKAASDVCKPDVISYQGVINAWSTSKVWGAPQRCEDWIHHMDHLYKISGDANLKPNKFCFTAAINAWSKSKECNKARSAYRILQHMNHFYEVEGNADVKPCVVSYTAVLNACGYPNDVNENRDSFDIAWLTMQELQIKRDIGQQDDMKPNHVTYAAFLNVCARTLPEGRKEREDMVRQTFVRCCQEGQVGKVVLAKLRFASSPQLYKELLGGVMPNLVNNYDGDIDGIDDDVLMERLPHEWSRHVRGEVVSNHGRRKQKKVAATNKSEEEMPLSPPALVKLKAIQKGRGTNGFYSQDGRNKSTSTSQQHSRKISDKLDEVVFSV